VGKTVLTGLLLCHLRQAGRTALALKPFCSGGTGDVDVLDALQDHELPRRRVNPFYFTEPVAPLVAARRQRRRIALREVLDCVYSAAGQCECLLVEGAGGLLAPLGEGYTAAEVISRLNCETIVVARNKLGAINHTLLTARALRSASAGALKFVVMQPRRQDLATRTNMAVLAEWLGTGGVFSLPFLGPRCRGVGVLRKNAVKFEKVLQQVLK
jgi:dethiobiotin synthetase